MKKGKKVWVGIGIVVAVALIILAWFFGFFGIVFYVLGLYAALYFISLVFKTTKIISGILSIGYVVLFILLSIGGLFLLYLVLKFMFEDSFLLGLILLIFGLPIAEMLLYGLVMALGYPLVWFLEDLERRFGKKEELSMNKFE